MTRIGRGLRERGSALLNVMIFAALMAVMTPVLMEFYKQNAKTAAFTRDILVKNLSFASVASYSMSPAALYATFRYSTDTAGGNDYAEASGAPWAAAQIINPCYRGCLRGHQLAYGSDPALPRYRTPQCQAAEVYTGGTPTDVNACSSRAADNKLLWYYLTLFHPIEPFTAVSGPDPMQPAAAPALRTPVRYTLEGLVCPYSAGSANAKDLCPFELASYFHPICPGDALLDTGPRTYARNAEDSARRVIQMTQITSPPPSPAQRWKSEIWPEIKSASAGTGNCRNLSDLDLDCSDPAPIGFVKCPKNPCMAYEYGAGNQFICCRNFLNTGTYTGTGTGTDASLVCNLTAAASYCATACTGHRGPQALGCNPPVGGAFRCECRDGYNESAAAYDGCCAGLSPTVTTTDTALGTLVKTCSMAAAVMVWYRVSWTSEASNPASVWYNNYRWAGFKRLDSLRDNLDKADKIPAEIPQTRTCGRIFSTEFNPPNLTALDEYCPADNS